MPEYGHSRGEKELGRVPKVKVAGFLQRESDCKEKSAKNPRDSSS